MMLNGREVEINEMDYCHESPLVCEAVFIDDGKELTESELEEFEAQNREALDEMGFENQIMRAESIYEGDR